MSRGLGARQRALLAAIECTDDPEIGPLPVMAFLDVPNQPPSDDPFVLWIGSQRMAIDPRRHSAAVANRRAIHGLCSRGLVEIWVEPLTFSGTMRDDRPWMLKVRDWVALTPAGRHRLSRFRDG